MLVINKREIELAYIRNTIQVIQSLCRVGMRLIVTSTCQPHRRTYNTIIICIYMYVYYNAAK